MPKLISTVAALALFAGLTAPVLAADTYEIDPQHAWVAFSINHAGWSTASGLLSGVTGQISFDKDDATKSTVSVSIDATTLSSGFADRDRDLQGPDFFNTAEFPAITFASTAVEKTGEKTGRITGDLTLIGVTRPVTLDVVFNAETPLPWDATALKAGFTATGSITPADFGMAKVTEFGLGPDVPLTINVEAFKK